MLVLAQKAGEAVQLGADITIRILDVKAGKVRLGISAPPEVAVKRVEADAPTAAPAAAARSAADKTVTLPRAQKNS